MTRILMAILLYLVILVGTVPTQAASTLLAGVTGGGNAGNTLANYVCISRFQATASGQATEIHVYGGDGRSNTKVALYSDSNGNPLTLLASAEGTLLPRQDNSVVINAVAITQGSYYWIAAIGALAGYCTYNTSGAGGVRRFAAKPYASYTYPATWNDAGYTRDAYLIYCGVYSADGLPPEPAPLTDTVVCMGDSVTFGYPSGGATSYPYVLQQCLPTYTVTNKGINGDRTDQMLARFQTDVLAVNPKYVIIWGGENDIAQNKVEADISWVTTNLSAMYSAARTAGIKVIAITIIPMKGWVGYTELRTQRIKEINAWIKSQPVDYVIDIYTLLDNGTGAMWSQYRSADYAHLNNLGYAFTGALVYGTVWSPSSSLEYRVRALEQVVGK
jgi:lysophospholipase L1-like esterase